MNTDTTQNKNDLEKKEETVIAPFGVESPQEENESKKEVVQKEKDIQKEAVPHIRKLRNVSIGSISRLVSRIQIQYIWIMLVCTFAVVTVGLFLYAGIIFWDIVSFEEEIDINVENEDTTRTLQQEDLQSIRVFFDEKEREFQRLEYNPPSIPEIQ